VPDEFLFAADDRIRLQIEVNQPGIVMVTNEDKDTLYQGIVRPGSPLTMPQEITVGERDRRVIDVRFAPAPLAAEQEAQTLRSEFRAQSDSRTPRSKARLTSSAPEPPFPATLSLQVILRRKP
jgi:hypothetical protein